MCQNLKLPAAVLKHLVKDSSNDANCVRFRHRKVCKDNV